MQSITGRLLTVFGGIGLVLVAVVVVGVVADAGRGARMVEADGTITGYERRPANGESAGSQAARVLHPVVEFRTADGGRVTFTSDWGRQGRFRPVGSSVRVRYRPEEPSSAELLSYVARFGALTVVGLVAMPFLATATYLLVTFVNERRRLRRGERNLRREV